MMTVEEFDELGWKHTKKRIIDNIMSFFQCNEEDICNFREIHSGLTNLSFVFQIHDVDYVYRHPGEGTENIISRRNEKKSLIKAKELNFDPTFLYADINEGWKISLYISDYREPDYYSFADSIKIIDVMRRLHSSDIYVEYGMKPWEDSLELEKKIILKDQNCFKQYGALKEKIGCIYKKTIGDGVKKCFCHGDTYQSNWMIKPNGEVVLIDWEYSGYADPGIDVGYYIVDAMYDFDEAEEFIKEYLQDGFTDVKLFHFMAYVAIMGYYWFVWAMYRELCGGTMGNVINNWRKMAEKYVDYLLEKEQNENSCF